MDTQFTDAIAYGFDVTEMPAFQSFYTAQYLRCAETVFQRNKPFVETFSAMEREQGNIRYPECSA